MGDKISGRSDWSATNIKLHVPRIHLCPGWWNNTICPAPKYFSLC